MLKSPSPFLGRNLPPRVSNVAPHSPFILGAQNSIEHGKPPEQGAKNHIEKGSVRPCWPRGARKEPSPMSGPRRSLGTRSQQRLNALKQECAGRWRGERWHRCHYSPYRDERRLAGSKTLFSVPDQRKMTGQLIRRMKPTLSPHRRGKYTRDQ